MTCLPAVYAPALDGLSHSEWVRHPETRDSDLADVDPANRAFLLRMPQRRATGRRAGFTASRTVWRGHLPLAAR